MGGESDRLKIALLAAGATFFFGLVLLLLREWLDSGREKKQKQEELRALLDAYVAEIVFASERCAQFVRQVCMNRVSRAKLSLLVGAGRITRVGALGGSTECVRALHAVYRLFDQVEFQISKNNSDEFSAILAFVRGEYQNLTEGFRVVLDHARASHGVSRPRIGKRLFLKILVALGRTQEDFLFGAPACPESTLLLKELDTLEKRFTEIDQDCREWFEVYDLVLNLAFGAKSVHEESLGQVESLSVPIRGKVLRSLAGLLRGYMSEPASSETVFSLDWGRLVISGYKIAGLPVPPVGSSGMSIDGALAAFEAWWLKFDRRPWD